MIIVNFYFGRRIDFTLVPTYLEHRNSPCKYLVHMTSYASVIMLNNGNQYSDLIDTTEKLLSIIDNDDLTTVKIDDEKYFFDKKRNITFPLKKYHEMLDVVGNALGIEVIDECGDVYVNDIRQFNSILVRRCNALVAKYNLEPMRNPELFVHIDVIVGRNKGYDESDLVNLRRNVLTHKYVELLRSKYIEAYDDENFGSLDDLERKMKRHGYVYQETEQERNMKIELIDRVNDLYSFLGMDKTVDQSYPLQYVDTIYNNLLIERDTVVSKWSELEKMRRKYSRLCRIATDILDDVDTTDMYTYDLETLKKKYDELVGRLRYDDDEETNKFKEEKLRFLRELYVEKIYDNEQRIPSADEYMMMSIGSLRSKVFHKNKYLKRCDTKEYELKEKIEDRFFEIIWRCQDIEQSELCGSGPSQYESYKVEDMQDEISDLLDYAVNNSDYDDEYEDKMKIIEHICNTYKKYGIVRCPSEYEGYMMPYLEKISNLVDIGVKNAEDLATEVVNM